MLRMSFLEHLEELRARIIRAVIGVAVAFVGSLSFSSQLWDFVRQPATNALKTLHYDPELAQIAPMDNFQIIWVKLPIVCAIFLSSPWILYQIWAFISPGLYRKEKRWAAPFILCSAGLFIVGGVFAYFVIFPYGLTFLLGIGRGQGVKPVVSITEYFDLFVNVVLGVGLVFEMPVLIFFLTLLRIVTPSFLLSHSRYAILAIFIIAAIVTPTPDVFNLMLFATPMCILVDLNTITTLAGDCSQQNYHPLYVGLAVEAGAPYVKGMPSGTTMVVAENVFPWFAHNSAATDDYWHALQTYEPTVFTSTNYGPSLAMAWASGQMFAAAASHMGAHPSAAAVKAGLYSLKDETLGGLVPPTTYGRARRRWGMDTSS